jgi:hypothetical protein
MWAAEASYKWRELGDCEMGHLSIVFCSGERRRDWGVQYRFDLAAIFNFSFPRLFFVHSGTGRA